MLLPAMAPTTAPTAAPTAAPTGPVMPPAAAPAAAPPAIAPPTPPTAAPTPLAAGCDLESVPTGLPVSLKSFMGFPLLVAAEPGMVPAAQAHLTQAQRRVSERARRCPLLRYRS